MSSRSTPHRRPRSEIEDDDSDMARRSHDSTPSNDSAKRVRTNGYQSEQQSSSSRQRSSNIYDDNDEDDIEGASDTDEGTNNEFQPGAIVRVKLTNFITYENAEFFPGPNLNMVIGPNGTGKSSLVCAICLGLGWNPSHLGRAGQIGEFVKHNKNDAYVEIELQRRPTEARNHVVRLRIIKDGNLREWWLDGRKTSHKNIQKVTTDFNIQVDNLCQFLPQDKVSEFAALSPEDLLLQTQRAAAPEEMLQQHEQLKQLRKLQKTLDIQLEQDKESLGAMENRQENLRAEVQRLQERREIQERISLLQKTVPFAEYKIARMRHMEYKKKKEDAQARFRDLEENLGPTIASIKHKEDYRDQIEVVVKERKAVVDSAEREAASCIKDIEGLDENIQKNEKAIEFERVGEGKRRKEVAKIQRTITNLKAKANEEPIEFDAGTWNERIRAKDKLLREIDAELRELKAEDREISIKGREVKDNISNAEIELAALDTHEGQQLNRLEKVSRETAKAWKWVQDNADKFDKEVYGPPLISCSIKDARYIDAIESIFRQSDYLTITAQTTSDFKKLSDYLHGEMKFAEFPLRTSDSAGLDDPRPLSRQDLNRLGMDGWAIDFIDGPEAVLSMLCGSIQVHRTAISLRDITDDQYNGIVEAQQLNSFVAGSHSYKITRRKEYGPLAVSTSTRAVSPARYWVDQPVDTAAREEIQHKIVFLRAELEKLKTQITPIREKIKDLNSSASEAKAEAERLKEEKGTLQKARNEQLGIPTKIESEEKDLDVKSREKVEYLARIKTINTQQDHAVLLKAKLSLGYKSIVTKIRSYHEDLLDAEVRLIEAKSDVEGLKDRNRDIDQQIEDERRQVKEAEKESKKMKDAAQKSA
ncbi:hypothetical protein G7Y89_g5094 [Cudoniella acicularis]|uniref:Structural maintenance of chromosomes protein 5 n=1 Tax=Cudoniella acicularis TaxID=354080 RepID=A0A8H4RNX8_9HELO|nr:hypothetical protein G7Y89_g5094 [Cudoniella acicularis]